MPDPTWLDARTWELLGAGALAWSGTLVFMCVALGRALDNRRLT